MSPCPIPQSRIPDDTRVTCFHVRLHVKLFGSGYRTIARPWSSHIGWHCVCRLTKEIGWNTRFLIGGSTAELFRERKNKSKGSIEETCARPVFRLYSILTDGIDATAWSRHATRLASMAEVSPPSLTDKFERHVKCLICSHPTERSKID
jgi:hypothetical protein